MTYFITAGFDQRYTLWNEELGLVGTKKFVARKDTHQFRVRALDVQDTGMLVLGTTAGFILKANLMHDATILVRPEIQTNTK
jgi:hypothetical protein